MSTTEKQYTAIDIHQILKRLPHRYPFLLVDRVLQSDGTNQITALKNVTINEPFFGGHFPNRPVMPGVLILEAMAQAAALLLLPHDRDQPDPDVVYYFAGIDNARFKRPVEPGDQLLLHVRAERARAGIYKFHATATVAGELACEADLMCTVRRIAN